MRTAKVSAIATFLPETVLSNDALAALYPDWSAEKIFAKTGIRERRISATGETAGDLAEAAARRLFEDEDIEPGSIDFLLFCSQGSDYILPATACILHARLGLRTEAGALDFSLGCSGFVHGLALAKGLIDSGQVARVLLLTADTYSKLIHPMDRSVRTLFGDGAAATLVEARDSDEPLIGPIVFGADGSGAQNLITPAGGSRRPRDAETATAATDPSGNVRSLDNLYMNGPAIVSFTLREVPRIIERLLAASESELEDFDAFVFHQANGFMLERVRRKLDIPSDKFVLHLEHCGNTVSSSIPIALQTLVGRSDAPAKIMLVGFGVGYSWAAASISLN